MRIEPDYSSLRVKFNGDA